MDISGIKYIADQIFEHCRLFKPRSNLTGFQLRANYPSKYPASCRLRIYEMGYQFYIMGRADNGKDIRLAIRCEPLKDRLLRNSRKKDVKHFRKGLVRRLSYNNLITVDPNGFDVPAIRILIAAYLKRDGIIDAAPLMKLLAEYYGRNYIPLSVIEAIDKFSIPLTQNSIRSFLALHRKDGRSKNAGKSKGISAGYHDADLGIDDGDLDSTLSSVHNRTVFTDAEGEDVPKTTVYSWATTGKMTAQRDGYRYKKDAGFYDEMAALNKKRIEKRACSLMAKSVTGPDDKLKTIQRRIQRYRERGLSIKEIANRIGYKTSQIEGGDE